MTEFTPGPWHYEPGDHEDTFVIYGPNSEVWRVAETYAYQTEPKASEANARLITAAPDLLAALENLLSETVSVLTTNFANPRHDMIEDVPSIKAARVAIAKARNQGS